MRARFVWVLVLVVSVLYVSLLLEVYMGLSALHTFTPTTTCDNTSMAIVALLGRLAPKNHTGPWFPEPLEDWSVDKEGAACPTSYYVGSKWGHTHNVVRSFLKGLVVSRQQGKTLDFPEDDYVHFQLELSAFDLSALRNAGYCFRLRKSKDLETPEPSGLFNAAVPWRPLLALLRPTPADDLRVREVIRTQIGVKGYVGVHLRFLDGECPVRLHKLDEVPGLVWSFPMEHMCPGDVEWLVAELQRPLVPRTIFLAHDHQRTPDVERLRNALQQKGRKVIMSTESPTVDYWLLVRSSLFVGNALSSFSSDVCSVKRVLGLGACVMACETDNDGEFGMAF